MTWTRAAALGAALTPAVPALAWAQQSGQYHGPHMMGPGGWGWVLGPVMMIVMLAVAVAVVVVIVRWLGGHQHPPAQGRPGETPLDILEKRFARGEIDKEAFEERRKMLER